MLGDTWKDKVDGVDVNSADDINQVAHAVINLENKGTKITVDSELDVNSENPVQNKVVTAKFNDVDKKIAEIEPTIIEEGLDVGEAIITMEDNHIYSFNMILNKLDVSFPETMKNGYTSALYFFSTYHETIPSDYTSFPSNVKFKGDSVVDGRFVPERTMLYTILFDYYWGNIIGYVSGVSLE